VIPDNDVFILDSYALLAYLGGEAGQARVKIALKQAKGEKCRLLLCMINFGEVLYMTERRRGFAAAQSAQALIENLPIDILDATRNLVLDAAHFKANYALSYADAFVVALAQREGGTILTGDPEFQSVNKLVTIEWLE
jgi:predicted nucleic acid-binding protein